MANQSTPNGFLLGPPSNGWPGRWSGVCRVMGAFRLEREGPRGSLPRFAGRAVSACQPPMSLSPRYTTGAKPRTINEELQHLGVDRGGQSALEHAVEQTMPEQIQRERS